METSTLVKSHTVQFQLGEWASDTTLDGRKVLYRFNIVGPNHLREEQISLPNTTDRHYKFLDLKFHHYMAINCRSTELASFLSHLM